MQILPRFRCGFESVDKTGNELWVRNIFFPAQSRREISQLCRSLRARYDEVRYCKLGIMHFLPSEKPWAPPYFMASLLQFHDRYRWRLPPFSLSVFHAKQRKISRFHFEFMGFSCPLPISHFGSLSFTSGCFRLGLTENLV